MKTDIHDKIILVAKIAMFTVFGYNILRVIVKTWKYGGSTTKVCVSYDDDDDDPIPTEVPDDGEGED